MSDKQTEKTIQLDTPIKRGKTEITEIVLRKPQSGALRGTRLQAVMEMDVASMMTVIPRISTLEVVMQPLLNIGVPREACAAKAAQLLTRLNVPERLWHLAPSTFSGGEQQRVNIARGFIVDYPILLLDEPTASLDAKNSAAVVELIREAKARGAAIVGIFHDEAVRNDVADRLHPMGASS